MCVTKNQYFLYVKPQVSYIQNTFSEDIIKNNNHIFNDLSFNNIVIPHQ